LPTVLLNTKPFIVDDKNRRKEIGDLTGASPARILIEWSVPDYTNGFRFYTPKAVRLLSVSHQEYKGYIYLSESLSQLLRAGLRVRHFPIRFVNRQRGVSNTNLPEISASLKAILAIAWQHHFAK